MDFKLMFALAALLAAALASVDEPQQNENILAYRVGNRMFQLGKDIHTNDLLAWSSFDAFLKRHNRIYESKDELLKRFNIYQENMQMAAVWQRNELGTAVYGETEFSDLTTEEFRKIMLPYHWPLKAHRASVNISEYGVSNAALPDTVDWRTKNAVTPVKNQGYCGSCWAFSTTGNIEGAWAIKKGKLLSLSEQELLDCDVVDMGCSGGLPTNAYKEIIRMGGLEPESDYPYDAAKEQCHLARRDIAVYINDSIELPPDEDKIAAWLATKGPVSVGLNAALLQFYRHGISHPWKVFCSPAHLDHGVLIVGYGSEGNKPYWIVKNSWGPKWGEAGYFRLYRGKNVCGINAMATSAIVD